jgi:hypothetical protein
VSSERFIVFRSWTAIWFCVVIVAVAAVLRIWASLGDLWLDEIWSVAFAGRITSPLEVFTRIHRSNNNHLNTLLLYLLGDQPHWVIYRVPSVVAGIATVLVAGHIGLRRGRTEAVFAMLLTSFSYLLIHYSSEARGYGLALFFDLLALDFLESYLVAKSAWKLPGFWVSCILSLLSHLMFVMVYAGLAAWSVVRLARERRGWGEFLGRLAILHCVPLAAMGLLYAVDIRHMKIDAAPAYSAKDAVLETLALAVGGPQYGHGAFAAAIVAFGLLAAGAFKLFWTERSDDAVFYLTVIVIAPILLIAFGRSEAILIRYFLGSVLFFLILLSRLLANWWRGDLGEKVLAGMLTVAFLAGNGWHDARLLRWGRGDYWECVRFMADNTSGDTVTVGSDHDFRNRWVVDFYAKYLPADKSLFYYSVNSRPPEGTQWMILHRQDKEADPPRAFMDEHRNRYALVRDYPYAGLSGYRWLLYRNLRQR